MPRLIRAPRYLSAGNEALAEFITDELQSLDLKETVAFYNSLKRRKAPDSDLALLACNDRFFLLVSLCGRKDAIHPWVFARCREVEAEPDGYLDLWARYHYKSSIITFAGILQECLIDPELTVGIFSFRTKAAQDFLAQIKREYEQNQLLKRVFSDVLWDNPKVQAPKWSETTGLVLKRQGNPREPTIGAYGFEALPVGLHFRLLVYDDLIERRHVTNPEMIIKATEGWELSDNLGHKDGTRKWHAGTRYLFGDTYSVILERKILKERIYPATHNGQLDGEPVLLTPERWAEVKKAQRSTVSAQMLQNPAAGNESTFRLAWFRPYETLPHSLSVWIMGDPSLGKTRTSDRTAIPVIGIDAQNNKYLLDGVRHRMSQSERWEALKMLYQKWSDRPGVQSVQVGWEVYGMQNDLPYFEEKMRAEKGKSCHFAIKELNWVREGSQSKDDRIARLEPDLRNSKFYLPWFVYHEGLGDCSWRVNDEGTKIEYKPARVEGVQHLPPGSTSSLWLTKRQREAMAQGKEWLVPSPIKRKDENSLVYDVTRAFIEEAMFHPFAPKKDFIDATSRLYDMEPHPAASIEQLVPEVIEYPDA